MKPRKSTLLPDGLRDLRQAFAGVRDPRLAVLDPLPESLRPSGALLATVLGQDIGMGSLARLMRELQARLGDDLLGVPAANWTRLERATKFAWLAEWPHKESLPGWILSVSDFYRCHGPVEGWKGRFETPEQLIETMARELPWMGSRSPSKVKGWRLARWLVRAELAEVGWSEADRDRLVMPAAAVERPLRTLGWLPGGFSEWSVGRRQEWLDQGLAPEAGADRTAVWVPLETVLARGRNGPACQEHLRGCGACPVRSSCPSPARV